MSNLELILIILFASVCVCFVACAILVAVCCRRKAKSSAKSNIPRQTSHICRVPSFIVYNDRPNHLTVSQSKDSDSDNYVNCRATLPGSSLSVRDKSTVIWHMNKVDETSKIENKVIDTNEDEMKGVENLTYFCNQNEINKVDNQTESTLRCSEEPNEQHLPSTENKDSNDNIDNDKHTHVIELNPERRNPAVIVCPDVECDMSESYYEDIDNIQIDTGHQRVLHRARNNYTSVQKSTSVHPTSIKTHENAHVRSATEAERTAGHSNFYQNCEPEMGNSCLIRSDDNRHYSHLSDRYDSKTTVTTNSKEPPFSKLEIVNPIFSVMNPSLQKDGVYSKLGKLTEHIVNEYDSLGHPLVNDVSTQSARGYTSKSIASQMLNASVNNVPPSLKTSTPVELIDLIPSAHSKSVLAVQEPTIHATKPILETHVLLFPLIETPGHVDCLQSQKLATTDHIYYELENQNNVEDNAINIPPTFTHIKTTTPLWYSTVEIPEDTTHPTIVSSSVDPILKNHTTKSRTGNIKEDIKHMKEIFGRCSTSNLENATTDETYSDISKHPCDNCSSLSREVAQIQVSNQQLVDPFTDNSIYYELESESD